MRITLVELPATLNGRLLEKPVEDFFSIANLPSRAIPLLHGILNKAGYQDVEQINPKFNRSKILSKQQSQRLFTSDVVGISTITRTVPQSYELARMIREHNPRAKIFMGGTHVSVLPEEALDYCDIVIRQEGDRTLPLVIHRLKENFHNPYLKDVDGISFWEKDIKIHNSNAKFLTNEELSSLPLPVLMDNDLKSIDVNTIITSRGCPYSCEYCSVIENFGRRFRYVDDDSLLELLGFIKTKGNKPVFFADDSFAANTKRTKRILNKMLEGNIQLKRWYAQVRVESAFDDELMGLMKKAGCSYVFTGIESINDATLKLYNKKSTLEKNREAIARFQNYGLFVHGMFVLGADTDNVQTIQQTLDFAKSSRINTAQFFILTPLPGTQLTRKYEAKGRIITKAWHKYDTQHVVIDHPGIPALKLQEEVDRISLDFYSFKEAGRSLMKGKNKIWDPIIRISGHFLAKKILALHSEHKLFLKSVDQWKQEVLTNFYQWKEEVLFFPEETLQNKEAYQQKVDKIIKDFEKIHRQVKESHRLGDYGYDGIKEYIQKSLFRIQREADLLLTRLKSMPLNT